MTDTVTVSRELLRQAIDALNEADNVLTSSMFAESADSLRAALDAEPAPEAKPEKLNPLTQLQVAYVMGLRDANSAPQPAPVQEPDAIGCKCSVCGEWQRWTPSGMVCKNGHGGADGINHRLYTQPRKAVKLSDSEIASDASRHWSEDGVDPIAFAHAIESAVWAKNGWAE